MLNCPRVLVLRESLARAAVSPTPSACPEAEKELRDEVCGVVEDLRAAGWPPERALIAIKEIALTAGLRASQGVLVRDRDLAPQDALLAKVVRWTIECYFDVSQPAY